MDENNPASPLHFYWRRQAEEDAEVMIADPQPPTDWERGMWAAIAKLLPPRKSIKNEAQPQRDM